MRRVIFLDRDPVPHFLYGGHDKKKCDRYWGKKRSDWSEYLGRATKSHMPWYMLCT